MQYRYLTLLFFYSSFVVPHAITYTLNGGRFGDNLSTYCKAAYYAKVYELPLLYQPFEYADNFTLHTAHTLYTPEIKNTFSRIITVKTEKDIKDALRNSSGPILFISDFYSQVPNLYDYGYRNPAFAHYFKTLLTPIAPPPPLAKDPQSVAVALHVRKGGGFDKPLGSEQEVIDPSVAYADKIWPTKFPADEYYIDQIRAIRGLISQEKSITLYLFTDDRHPELIAQKYADALKDSSITFSYRQAGNSHNAHVVEDFYYMAECDCLIRSSSLLATASQLLGNHSIIIYPIHGTWQETKPVIDPVGIIMRNNKAPIS